MKHFLRMERLKIRYKSKVRWLFSVMTEQARVSRTTPAQRETSIEKMHFTSQISGTLRLNTKVSKSTTICSGEAAAGLPPRSVNIGRARGVGGSEGWGDPRGGGIRVTAIQGDINLQKAHLSGCVSRLDMTQFSPLLFFFGWKIRSLMSAALRNNICLHRSRPFFTPGLLLRGGVIYPNMPRRFRPKKRHFTAPTLKDSIHTENNCFEKRTSKVLSPVSTKSPRAKWLAQGTNPSRWDIFN